MMLFAYVLFSRLRCITDTSLGLLYGVETAVLLQMSSCETSENGGI